MSNIQLSTPLGRPWPDFSPGHCLFWKARPRAL